MSMEIIGCKNCDGTIVPMDGVSVHVDLTKNNWCDKCYHGHTDKQFNFFCSIECFNQFILKVVNGQEKIEWKECKSHE